ncbi:hypothetical protein SEPCBS57363_006838, partial [Sporothrix epigloea]
MAGGGLSLHGFSQATRADPGLAQLLSILEARQRAQNNEVKAQLAAQNAQAAAQNAQVLAVLAKLTERDDRRSVENANL